MDIDLFPKPEQNCAYLSIVNSWNHFFSFAWLLFFIIYALFFLKKSFFPYHLLTNLTCRINLTHLSLLIKK
jgi:uncharacterized membrane protein (DUF485 family)